ncbi:MAG: twin-arginine translocase TatA/TatE family subunit [Rhizobiaceae bacterium]
MGQIGIWQIVIIAVVVVLLFGRGKISDLMGDVAKGINSFKKGLNDNEEEVADKIEDSKEKVVDAVNEKTKTS